MSLHSTSRLHKTYVGASRAVERGPPLVLRVWLLLLPPAPLLLLLPALLLGGSD